MLSVSNLTRHYRSPGGEQLTVLDNVSFNIPAGETFSIVGPSGSGKTTLLGLCAGLDRASSGSVVLNEIKLDTLSEDERAEVRNRHVGFVFQSFQLIPTLTALENVMVPMELRGDSLAEKVSGWRMSGSGSVWFTFPPSFLVVNSRESVSLALFPPARRYFLPTNPRAIWMPITPWALLI
jgi:predicted ABC-type transport system involved in lysophospholipase L1 biosynthesis ATPase subunit